VFFDVLKSKNTMKLFVGGNGGGGSGIIHEVVASRPAFAW
jgi:hypothetical protein